MAVKAPKIAVGQTRQAPSDSSRRTSSSSSVGAPVKAPAASAFLGALPSLSGTSSLKPGTAPTTDINPSKTIQVPAAVEAPVKTPTANVDNQIRLLEEAIKKTGDPDGQRQKTLDRLRGVSPEVAPVATTAEPVADPLDPVSEVDKIKNQAEADTDEAKQLQQSLLDSETDYKDTLTEIAEDKYQVQTKRLEQMQDLQGEVMALRKESIEASSAAQKAIAKAAYEASIREQDAQRERTTKAYQDAIVEQELSNTKRQLEMESYIAALGGFGSLTSAKQITELTLANDRVLNTVKFEADAADRDISNEIVTITDNYKTNIQAVEAAKQEAINNAYTEYLSYIDALNSDEAMAEDERAAEVKRVQSEYKKNVAQINNDAFNTRYAISQTAAAQVRDLKVSQVDVNASAIFGYAVDSTGKAILDEKGNKVTVPTTGVQYEFIEPKFDAYGRMTSPGGYFDPSTGEFTQDTSLGVPSYVRGANGYNYPSPEVKQQMSDIFGVGTVGGWCGVYASKISTAEKVGDMWSEKKTKIKYRDNPKQGDKLLMQSGATDSSGYGHVAVVLSYDESTGDIQVVESNADGKGGENGIVSLGTYNINTLREKYGDGFGFTPGELREPYKDLVDGAFSQSTDSVSITDLQNLAIQYGYTTSSEMENFVNLALDGVVLPLKETASSVVNTQEIRTINKEVRTSDEFKTITKAQAAIEAIKVFASEYDKIKDDTIRGKKLTGSGVLSSAYQSMIVNLKEFYNLGALTGPDVDLLEDQLPNPTSAFNSGWWKGGSDIMESQLEQLTNQFLTTFNARAETLYTSYGDYFGQVDALDDLMQKDDFVNAQVDAILAGDYSGDGADLLSDIESVN